MDQSSSSYQPSSSSSASSSLSSSRTTSSSSISTDTSSHMSDFESFGAPLARQTTMEAPLSSPSMVQPSQYFGAPQPQHQYNTRSMAAQKQSFQPLPRQSQPQNAASPFLRDFNLVAEAAKRAQMAVLMRDMEACGFGESR